MPNEAQTHDQDEIPEDQLTEEELAAEEASVDEDAAFEAAYSGEDLPEESEANAELEEVEDDDDDDEQEPPLLTDVVENPPVPEDGLANRVRSLEGKIGTLTDQLTRSLSQNAEARTPDAEAPSPAQLRDAAGSSEKMEKLAAEFPEWGEAMEEQINLVQSTILSQVPSADQINEAIGMAAENARQLARLDMKYDGWEETVRTEAFRNWIAAQDEQTQALADSQHAVDAITLLDKFSGFSQNRQSGGSETNREQQHRRLRQATAPTKGSSRSQREAPDEDAEFEKGFYNS